MTLIVTSLRAGDVLITADGRSRKISDGRVIATIDNYQKIFPIPNCPIAIFHHGENRLDGMPVRQFLARFIERSRSVECTVEAVACELRQFADWHVKARLNELGWPEAGCGFCVAGFAVDDFVAGDGPRISEPLVDNPQMIELFWGFRRDSIQRTEVDDRAIEERRWRPTSVVPSGDGQKLIDAVDWQLVAGRSIEEVRRYHQTLFEQAINLSDQGNAARAKPAAHTDIAQSVGGHVHELLITRAGWTWTVAPG